MILKSTCKTKFLFIILLLVVFNISSGSAQSNYLSEQAGTELVKKFSKKNNSYQSRRADFTETKSLKALKKPQISKGKFFFKASRQIRWEYLSPSYNCIVLKGDFIYIKSGNQKVKSYDQKKNKMYGGIGELLNIVSSEDLTQNKKFKFKVMESNETYSIELYPLDKILKNYIQRIEIKCNKQTLEMLTFSIFDAGSDKTEIQFDRQEFNIPIEDSTFILK